MDKQLKKVTIDESLEDTKLYILVRRDGADYDETRAVVVRASSPRQARKLASGVHGGEGPSIWMSTKTSSCNVLKPDGKSGIIIVDYKGG